MNLVNYQVIFQNLLEELELGKYSNKISQEYYFGHYLVPKKVESKLDGVFRNKFGGAPTVPTDFIWPKNLGFPMSFVMQLDLSELQFDRKDPENKIPESGLIYIFWDQRQICDDFSDWQDRGKVIKEFKKSFQKLPNFNDKTWRTAKGVEYRIIYLKEKQVSNLKPAKIPLELENYIFYTGCSGILKETLVYEEYFLVPTEKLHIPSSSKLKYQYKMTNLEFEKYCGIYNYWQKVYFGESNSIKLFSNWEKSVLFEIDTIDDSLPFQISLNPDLYYNYFSLSIQDFYGKVPNFQLDYSLEIID